jgi:hypothetical protein
MRRVKKNKSPYELSIRIRYILSLNGTVHPEDATKGGVVVTVVFDKDKIWDMMAIHAHESPYNLTFLKEKVIEGTNERTDFSILRLDNCHLITTRKSLRFPPYCEADVFGTEWSGCGSFELDKPVPGLLMWGSDEQV